MKKLFLILSLSALGTTILAQNSDPTKLVYIPEGVIIGSTVANASVLANDNYKLLVTGGILTERVRVATKGGTFWADYVFKPEYKLPKLSEVKDFIKRNGHLQDVPSSKEVNEKGIDLADTQRILLQKIEEQMLYILKQEERINALEKKLNKLSNPKKR